ncbi:MAG TPA: hypothetical protein VGL93_10030 [Streptosporangiaceae bacterium]
MIEGTAVVRVRSSPGRALDYLERNLADEVAGAPGGGAQEVGRVWDELLEVSGGARFVRYRFRCTCAYVDADTTEVTCHMWMQARPRLRWLLEPIARRTLLADPNGLLDERLQEMKRNIEAPGAA